MDSSSGDGDADAVERSARYCPAAGFRGGGYRRGRHRAEDHFYGRCAALIDEAAGGESPVTEHDDDGDGCARR